MATKKKVAVATKSPVRAEETVETVVETTAKAETKSDEETDEEAQNKATEAKAIADAEAQAEADKEAQIKAGKAAEKPVKTPEKIINPNDIEVDNEELVESVAKKAKMYKVKFVENHTFQVGIEKVEAFKGDKMEVEIHIANLLAQRKIAYIVN